MKKRLLSLSMFFNLIFSLNLYANWDVKIEEDTFEGRNIYVSSLSENKKGVMAFDDKNQIIIVNGDSYICSNYYSSYKNIEVSFKLNDEIFTQEFAISNNNKTLIYNEGFIGNGLTISKSDFTKKISKRRFGNRGIDVKKFINLLKETKTTYVRTSDSCGNVVDLKFDMSGFSKSINELNIG